MTLEVIIIPDPAPSHDVEDEDSGCRTAPTDDTAVYASAAEYFFARSVNHSRLSHALSFAVDPLVVVCAPDVNLQHLDGGNQGGVLTRVGDR